MVKCLTVIETGNMWSEADDEYRMLLQVFGGFSSLDPYLGGNTVIRREEITWCVNYI
jgi:hypothetical protein